MEDKIMKIFINQLIGKNIKANDNWKKMVKKGRKLANINLDKIVEIPMSLQGLKACKVLSGEGIKVNITSISYSAQALLAARAGADYISPVIENIKGVDTVKEISEMFKREKIKTKILFEKNEMPLDTGNYA